MPRSSRPTLLHALEYGIARMCAAPFTLLPVDISSNTLAAVARMVGPHLGLSRRVRCNLAAVWPDLPETERERLLCDVWASFARVANDYLHLDRIRIEQESRVEIVCGEYLDALRNTPGILFSAHMGNWETIPWAAHRHGLDLVVVNRVFNNPLMDAALRRLQSRSNVEMVLKGRPGARRIAEVLKAGGHVLMLVDVRMADGVAVPFMGLEAMTPSAPASLALRYGALLVPVRTERTGSASFRVVVEAPQPPVDTGNRIADIRATMTWVNERIEEWVRAHPEQWLWFHRRWGKVLSSSGSHPTTVVSVDRSRDDLRK